jgi:hypothetical protein
MNPAAELRPDPLAKRDRYLRIERAGRPTAPWIWSIYSADDSRLHRSQLSYRCAEDALKVGEVFLRKARAGQRFAGAEPATPHLGTAGLS